MIHTTKQHPDLIGGVIINKPPFRLTLCMIEVIKLIIKADKVINKYANNRRTKKDDSQKDRQTEREISKSPG